ncbi:PREDICTED: serine protease snake-like [Papilio xuthus]|uniref:Serine protease snake-like n=1 Tax=Papilio xuthus TaxID=66420 RepID=A0AAJ6Z642_PAPXU|nr:PREDICTED: serine protease snake-like [Papilio xuthus]XP_013166031.1 PREDICTED: serine protease snake-like [Papilio xuthus]
MTWKSFLVIKVLFIVFSNAQYEGDTCTNNGVQGTCKILRNCQSAVIDMRKGIPPQICSYVGMDAVVCCAESFNRVTSPRPYPLTTVRTRKKTTPVIPTYDYVINNRFFSNDGTCKPIDPTLTSPKTGQKAWDKCIEYQEKLVYPCKKTNSLSADTTGVHQARVTSCNHDVDKLIIGGMNASSAEFPHMALLGYKQSEDILWSCGGSIISERYILTAGHCTYSVGVGRVKYALVGILSRLEITEGSQRYDLEMPIRHPDYKPPSKYNDIALLKTTTEIILSDTVVPACLHVDRNADDTRALASGWGFTKYRGSTSDVLQKVILEKFSESECLRLYPGNRYLRHGFDPTTQICYGDCDESKDTCQGDSGGPLQLKNQKIKCMYTIVGVTSFGSGCGLIGRAGVYTKVTAYLPWIESIVWPK